MNKYLLWIFLLALYFSFGIFSGLINFISDWLWFSEVGYTEVLFKSLGAMIGIVAGVAIFSFVFLTGNFLAAVKSKNPWFIRLPAGVVDVPLIISGDMVRRTGIFISLAISLLLGLAYASQWQAVLKFLMSTTFGKLDPIFGKDISFYVFTLPVIELVMSLFKGIIVISLVGCAAMYIIRGNFNFLNFIGRAAGARLRDLGLPFSEQWERNETETEPKARLHIAVLLSLFSLTAAAGAYFSLFKLLVSQSGLVFGPGLADVNVKIPLTWLLFAAAIFIFVAVLHWGFTGRKRFFAASLIIYIFSLMALNILPPIVQQLIVVPNELAKETPFIRHNIAATRQAFGLDNVEEREISGDYPLTAADIARNDLTIRNVRLWDRAPLLSTFSQIQEIRTYYEFASVDNDRYLINGEIRQIMISPRELSSDSLPNRNWINERLTFTHGYGVAAGPVNQVTAGGLPPASEVKELIVTRPEIYYGELSNDYVIVKTKSKEFDYPKGEDNVFTTYAGKGGVKINSLFRRLLYSLRFGSLKFILSNDITNESRILYHRNIRERVSKIAPFLTFDRDPYIVIAGGKLFWIADAYTTSALYPYSQPLSLDGGRVNYIKNSVKAVIDAFDGSVQLYVADTADPIIKTYEKIFPSSFRPLSAMPANLAKHLRYPEDIFTLQTHIYTIYHMDDPQIFYNKEDQWEIPAIAHEGEAGLLGRTPAMTPRHMIMKLPSEKIEEYILMLPFTPRAKDNLSAWMVARNDGDNYGRLLVYRFPKQKLIFGPKQVIGRINQDSEISRQISLWDQRGSQVIQGSLLVIPLEESLIYVRPLYLKSDAGKIPELKRVIVLYENRIAMEETLEEGLARIFGAGDRVRSVPPPAEIQIQGIAKQAGSAYEAALRAQREGNWAKYGEEIKRLGELIRKLPR